MQYYAIQEISTGYWLHQNGVNFGPYNANEDWESNNIMEAQTEAELEAVRDGFNNAVPGRTGIFSSPRPH